MSQTYSYQIGILYFAGNIKSIRNILVKMLKADGYRVGVWTMDETADNAENSVDLYNFIHSPIKESFPKKQVILWERSTNPSEICRNRDISVQKRP